MRRVAAIVAMIVATSTAWAGIQFESASTEGLRTSSVPVTGPAFVITVPFKFSANPAGYQTIVGMGASASDAGIKLEMNSSGQVRGTYNDPNGGAASKTATTTNSADPNIVNVVSVILDSNAGEARLQVKLNGGSVASGTLTGYAPVITGWNRIAFSRGYRYTTPHFDGTIEQPYVDDGGSSFTWHDLVWHSGTAIDPTSDPNIAPEHRWPFTGTAAASVALVDTGVQDAVGAIDMADMMGTPVYTASIFGGDPVMQVEAGNLTSTGAGCAGPWVDPSNTWTITSEAGGGSLDYTVAVQDANDTWLTISNDANTIAAGATADVTVTINNDANSLSYGTHVATLVFTNTTNGNGDTTRTVTLTAEWDSAALALQDPNQATGYTWTMPVGGSCDANTFVPVVVNGGACPYVVNIAASDSAWALSFDANDCTADGSGGYDCNFPAGDTYTITAALDPNLCATYPQGAYAANLVFTPPTGDANDVLSVPLAFNVIAGSVIDPNDRVWGWLQTGDSNDVDVTEKTVTFTNTGPSGNIVFAFSDPNTLDLISLDALCTYTPGLGLTCPIDHDGNVVVTLAPNATSAAGLGAGAYSDTLMIYPEGDANAPLEIQTVLNVTTMSADYYVANTGTDTTSGGQGTSIDKPWRTIAYAISNATTGKTIVVIGDTYTDPAGYVGIGSGANGKTLTIQADGAVTLSNATYGIYAGSAWTSGTLTFEDMTVSGASTATLLYDLGAGTSHMKLTDCTISGGSRTGLMIAAGTATTSHNVTLTNCTIGAPVSGYDAVSISRDIATCKLVDCTVTAGTNNGVAVASAVTAGQTIIDGGTYDGTNCGASKAVIQWDTTNTYDLVAVRNATIATGRAGINLSRGVTTGIVENCTVTGVGANAVRLITIGQDASTAPVNPVLTAYCRNNTCTYSGAGVSHAILIGNGVTGGEVTGNVTNAGDYALVCKANGVAIHHNVLANSTTGGLGGVYFRCAHDCTLAYNTIVARAGDGVIGDTQAGGTAPARNVVAHNIVYVTGASNYRVNEATASVFATWVFDDNLYYGGKAAYIGAAKDALADLQAYWAATATRSWNEANSVETDPRFYSTSDFRAREPEAKGSSITSPGRGAYAGATPFGTGKKVIGGNGESRVR